MTSLWNRIERTDGLCTPCTPLYFSTGQYSRDGID